MVINTESTVGYNKQLKQAKFLIKLGIKNDAITNTKKRAYN